MSELAEFIEASAEPATGEQTEEVKTEVPAEPEVEATEDSTQEPTAEPESPPPGDDKPESGHVPIAALLDEREKRQRLQRELDEYRAQQQKAPQVPDVLDDQEGFVKHMQSQIAQSVGLARIELSQDFMRMQHEDYDAKEEQFVQMARDNPDLINKMNASSNPAKFAYDTVTKAERLAALENVDEWEAKKTAEIEARLRAEIEGKAKAKAEADAKASDSLSPSLTKQRAEGGNSGIIPDVPDPLETTFNR